MWYIFIKGPIVINQSCRGKKETKLGHVYISIMFWYILVSIDYSEGIIVHTIDKTKQNKQTKKNKPQKDTYRIVQILYFFKKTCIYR